MTESWRCVFDRRLGGVFLIPVFCFLLSGCALFQPPPVKGLPDRGSLQAGDEIIVGKNQNVYGLARKYGVSMREVIVLNDLRPPFTLKQGQRLLLPAKNQDNAPIPAAAPLQGIEQTPLEPVSTGSSTSHSVTSAPLEVPTPAPPPVASGSPKPLLEPPVPPAKPVATTVASGGQKMAALARPVEPSSSKAEVQFVWPVQGPILSEYGKTPAGTNNDGINIGAPKGASVAAAAGGIVVFAGNEMKGFGNLVLIRHEGGWVTAYAHLDRMLVNKDTVVAPGDMIGTVGNTGGVQTPQLHFETRLDGKAVDPQSVIKGS